jgi:hypothetical protein
MAVYCTDCLQPFSTILVHCKEIWIYVFPEKEWHGLSPNCHIHVSVSDSMFVPPIFLQKNGQTDQGNI